MAAKGRKNKSDKPRRFQTGMNQSDGSSSPDGQKIRVDLRKNRQVRARPQNLTHELLSDTESAEDVDQSERVTSRSDSSRKRTIVGVGTEGPEILRKVDQDHCRSGRVLSFIGLNCLVSSDNGDVFECSVRGFLRSMVRDSRNVVVAGDRVLFRQEGDVHQGVIERVEPRRGVLSRGSQGREHILVANVDQVLIVVSAADPDFKPQLVDRYLVSAERHQIQPLICINKIDLVDPRVVMDSVRVLGRAGYPVVLTSTRDGRGISQLRSYLIGRQTAVSGQSGVGKSSLLNQVDPQLMLQTADVSDWTRKGTHTTRRARLVPLSFGGWVADTPGIRQFEFWDISLDEVDGYFIEFRPFISRCRFPDCSHTHEEDCGVKAAVADGLIAAVRYQSYLRIREEDIFVWKNPARGVDRKSDS